jgi:RNA polymerase sigma-70 factor (ECF subfamily)
VRVGDANPPLHVLGEPGPEPLDWEAVYREHVVSLYRYVYARTGNRPDAEDVTSNVFIRALPRLRPDVSDGEMRAYLRATARTVIADLWRDRHGLAETSIDEESVSNAWASESVEKSVDGLLDQLPLNYRQVLELRFLRGYTVKETASTMGISVSNAKVLQLRALRRAATLQAEAPL